MIAVNRLEQLALPLEDDCEPEPQFSPDALPIPPDRQLAAPRGRRAAADESLAVLLASGMKVADAARQAGVGERTAYKRLTDSSFRERVRQLRSEMVDRALGKMSDGMCEAVETMRGLLKAQNEG